MKACISRVAPKHKATQHAGAAGGQTTGNQRLGLKVCKARQRGVEFEDEVQIETVKQGRGEWNVKMKSRLRLKVCEARQGGI